MSSRQRVLLVGLVGLAIAVALVLVLHREGADRIAHLSGLRDACESVPIDDGARASYAREWNGLEATAVIGCEHLGGSLFYARFASEGALRRTVRRLPPLERYCTSGDELVADSLLVGVSFRDLCDKIDGELRPPAKHLRSVDAD